MAIFDQKNISQAFNNSGDIILAVLSSVSKQKYKSFILNSFLTENNSIESNN